MNKDSDTLHHEIEATYDRIDRTLSQLGERLTLRAQLDGASDWFREKLRGAKPDVSPGEVADRVGHAGRRAGEALGDNPVAVGLGVLSTAAAVASKYFWGRESHEPAESEGVVLSAADEDWSPHHGMARPERLPGTGNPGASGLSGDDDGQHPLQTAREKASEWSDTVGDKVSGAGRQARRAASRAKQRTRSASARAGDQISRAAHASADKTRELAGKTRDRFEHGKDEYPVAVCLGALATGLLAAIALPASRREDRLYGEEAEQVKARAGRKADDLKARARRKGEELADQARDKLHEKRLDPEGLAERADEVIDHAATKADEHVEKHVEPDTVDEHQNSP